MLKYHAKLKKVLCSPIAARSGLPLLLAVRLLEHEEFRPDVQLLQALPLAVVNLGLDDALELNGPIFSDNRLHAALLVAMTL